ncbi:hypothetical protein BG015_002206 [Linnemannia schmuckeri]|uniref:Uncharacterized protein n=1 Tax=Linnemannia schmuckeri TaxID=64567 RepID=A0A9P5RPB7_9FUNG|nr:hypothetical protein BG015_002206 [Linnemannia schmuckeri]
MRFSVSTTAILFSLITFATFISAQAQEPVLSKACNDCLTRSGVQQAPSCANVTSVPLNKDGALIVDNLTKDQAACYCQLSSSDHWLRACSAKDVCGDVAFGADYTKVMADLKAATCPKGGSASSDAAGKMMVGGMGAIVTVVVVVVAASAILF